MTRSKTSSGDWQSSQKMQRGTIRGKVKSKGSNGASFYGKSGRKYTLSSRAQGVLSTVLEDMIEETLEDARKLAQVTGKDKVAIEDVEMAMVNLCQRLHPSSNSRTDDVLLEYDLSHKSENKNRRNHHEDRSVNNDSNQSLE